MVFTAGVIFRVLQSLEDAIGIFLSGIGLDERTKIYIGQSQVIKINGEKIISCGRAYMSTISLLCSHFGLSSTRGWVLKIIFKKYKKYYFNIFLNKKYFKNTVTNTAYESSTYWNTFCGLWLKGSRWWPARLVWCLIQGARDDHHYSHHYCLHVRSGVNFNLIPLDGVFGRWSVHPVQSVWAALLHKVCTLTRMYGIYKRSAWIHVCLGLDSSVACLKNHVHGHIPLHSFLFLYSDCKTIYYVSIFTSWY